MTNLYVHFLDVYHYARGRNSHSEFDVHREAQRACRLGLLAFDGIFIPASSFFESDLARLILDSHPLLTELGKISLIAGQPTLEDHREAKIRQYGTSSPLGLDIAYGTRAKCGARYVQGSGSARKMIERNWIKQVEENLVLLGIDPEEELSLPLNFENAWAAIPAELGDRAFIADHAFEVLSKKTGVDLPPLNSYMQRVIESSYMESYALSLGAGVMEDLICLGSPFALYSSPHSVSYTKLLWPVQRDGLVYLLDGSESIFLANQNLLLNSLTNRQVSVVAVSPTVEVTQPSSLLPAAPLSQRFSPERPTVGIITALPYEYLAVERLLTNIYTEGGSGSLRYLHGTLPGYAHHASQKVVVVQTGIAGTKPAAARATQLLLDFESVQDLVMVGIAGAIADPHKPDKDARLGDVVVSDRGGVVDVDHRLRTAAGDQSRSQIGPPSARLLGVFNSCEYSDVFRKEVDDRIVHLIETDSRFGRPPSRTDRLIGPNGKAVRRTAREEMRIFRGLVASGDSLVRDPRYRDKIQTEFGALALEMEAAGVAEAAHLAGRQYLVIRAFVDYCDENKSDTWHWHAAACAAAVSTTIISSIDLAGA